MKRPLAGVTLLLLLLIGAPAFALEALKLYDNFNASTLINHTKWTGSASDVLEVYKGILTVTPSPVDRELRLEARGYGFRTSVGPQDARSSNNRLRFRRSDPTKVRAIKATVKVNSYQAVGCPTAGSEITQSRFRLGGYFFNAGGGEPGRAVNDVLARVEIRRLSNSTDPANVLNVRGVVYRCIDNDCVLSETLFNQTLGTILVGNTATVLLQWDPATNRFLFQLNALPVVNYTYSLADAAPPQNSFDKKMIEIGHYIANCVAAQTQAYISVNVDDIYVNTAALAAVASAAQAEVGPVMEGLPEPEPYVPEPADMGWLPEPEPDFPKAGR
jgi:hypothetical protein